MRTGRLLRHSLCHAVLLKITKKFLVVKKDILNFTLNKIRKFR